MNKARRNALMKLQDLIDTAKESLEALLEEEEEARDNIPESMQSSERYERAETACDAIQSAIDALEEAAEEIEEAYQK